MIIPPNSTGIWVDVQILDDSGLAVTGLVAATFPTVKWSRAGNTAESTITLSDLALITSAHSGTNGGGVKERSNGYYRLDLPDAVGASAGTVKLSGEASGKHLICEPIEVRYVASNAIQIEGTDATDQIRDAAANGVLSTPADKINNTGGKLILQTSQPGVTIPTVTNVGTVSTLSGHTPQTGDSYPVVTNGTYGLSALKNLIDALPTASALATAVWSAVTRTITGFTTAAKAEIEAEATDALNAYDPPTRAEATADKQAILDALAALTLELSPEQVEELATEIAALIEVTGLTPTQAAQLLAIYTRTAAGVTVDTDGTLDDANAASERRGDTWSVQWTVPGNYSAKHTRFALKQNVGDSDADAVLLVDSTSGLTVLNKDTYSTTAHGTLIGTYNSEDAVTSFVLTVNYAATSQIEAKSYTWGHKSITDNDTLTEGEWEVTDYIVSGNS